MKLLLACLACVAAASCAIPPQLYGQDRSISSQVVDLIEAAQKQMPCGFPGLGIPPLAPLRFSHRKLSLGDEAMSMDGDFENFRLDGLDQFEIKELQVNVLFQRADFEFVWKKVRCTTDYLVDLGLKSLSMNRNGGAELSIMDLRIWGRITYSFSVVTRKIRVKTIKIYVSIGDVKSEIENLSSIKIINKKLNQLVEEWIMLAVNDNTDQMGDITDSILTPIVNNLIGDLTLGDLIGGGGGGTGEEPVEKEECIPPEDYEKFP